MKRLLIFLCLLLCVSFPALAEGRVIDEAGLLTDQEEKTLNGTIAKIAEDYAADVVILLKSSIGGRDVKMYAADYFDEHGFGMGANQDGLLFLLTMKEREYATVTSGSAISAFSDWTLDQIHEEITPYLTRGDYAEAFRRYLKRVSDTLASAARENVYDGGRTPFGMTYVISYRTSAFNRANRALPVILLVAFVIALIVVFSMKAQMKTVRKRNSANSYVKPGSFNLTRIQDIYLYTTTTRRRIQQDPPHGGHGGGGSTFHSSSGHSFGGRSGKF